MDTNDGKKIKYLSIKEDIIRMIGDAYYKSGDKLPSEQELAAQHQVSIITSKKALDELEKDGYIYRVKGSGSFVTERTQTAEPGNQYKMIAIVLPLGSNTGGGMELFSSVESIAKSHGYYVSVENTHFNCVKEREIILNLLKDNIRGIIYYPAYSAENFDLIKKLAMEKYPIVLIDKTIHDIDVDSVQCDNYRGSYEMTKYLIGCGHRTIAFAHEGIIDERSSLRERFSGYSNALAEANIPLNLDLVFYQNIGYHQINEKSTKAHFYKEIIEKLQMNKNITALQVASDFDAAEIIHQCNKKGINVPGEVSVVGFDDLDIASYITPSLTTVKQNFRQIGQTAAELVFSRLEDRNRKEQKVLVPAELIIRKSSAGLEVSGKRNKQ